MVGVRLLKMVGYLLMFREVVRQDLSKEISTHLQIQRRVARDSGTRVPARCQPGLRLRVPIPPVPKANGATFFLFFSCCAEGRDALAHAIHRHSHDASASGAAALWRAPAGASTAETTRARTAKRGRGRPPRIRGYTAYCP